MMRMLKIVVPLSESQPIHIHSILGQLYTSYCNFGDRLNVKANNNSNDNIGCIMTGSKFRMFTSDLGLISDKKNKLSVAEIEIIFKQIIAIRNKNNNKCKRNNKMSYFEFFIGLCAIANKKLNKLLEKEVKSELNDVNDKNTTFQTGIHFHTILVSYNT